ncbi:hypothetical protein G6F46_009535 [Rhizopus delemar]|uniref:BHLH domain-containing protein n=3 Tax=Rhizopus TaxID=4842 RepID=I1C954_RHIO9|nr:hypothetical protein RO3G_09694 [Rhizopus delemar RA 99-880]KAG1458161.1 hypothetical protein G6F55_005507 [Rhizopus delemar]KAG1538945.1 hypothetical protein G6F51_009452 [Rhizopus arrhizus]KAG1511636.1 hypothetical protein G6F53_005789 [Rhizopus delemar]KAG1522247.1 hypothetical protein G6F52_006031 [Rhizopus delemar]|eukprot:EIE84984.1 hypothetical protein RO3G_09694 [Rhizopus delemar RA 99-880]
MNYSTLAHRLLVDCSPLPMGYKGTVNDSVVDIHTQQQQDLLHLPDLNYLSEEPQSSVYQGGYVYDKQQQQQAENASPSLVHCSFQAELIHYHFMDLDSFHSRASTSSSHSSFQNDLLNQKDETVDNNSFEDDYINQTNIQSVMEKRRIRKESHNAVERRRRNNINERIQEIRTLLPGLFNDSKMSKGTILRKSVEQIRKLQSDIYQYKQRIQELESTLQQIRQ